MLTVLVTASRKNLWQWSREERLMCTMIQTLDAPVMAQAVGSMWHTLERWLLDCPESTEQFGDCTFHFFSLASI